MSDLQTVQAIYEAFGRGDIPFILEQLAPDVAWEPWEDHRAQKAGIDYLQPRHGPSGVAEFFGVIAEAEFREFQVLDLMHSGNQVAAELVIEFTRPHGTHVRDEEMHLWTFGADGKVTRFRHYLDTAKHIDAAAR